MLRNETPALLHSRLPKSVTVLGEQGWAGSVPGAGVGLPCSDSRGSSSCLEHNFEFALILVSVFPANRTVLEFLPGGPGEMMGGLYLAMGAQLSRGCCEALCAHAVAEHGGLPTALSHNHSKRLPFTLVKLTAG